MAVGAGALLAAYLVNTFTPWPGQWAAAMLANQPNTPEWLMSHGGVGMVWAIWAMAGAIAWANFKLLMRCKLFVGSHYLYRRRGFFQREKWLFVEMVHIEHRQTAYERALGLGTIEITTRTGTLLIPHVPNSDAIYNDLLNARRAAALHAPQTTQQGRL